MKYVWMLLLALALVFASFNAQAQSFRGGFTSQRQGNKEQTRWTLADYLVQKRNVQLMDQWLAVNRSANLFELYLGGGPVTYNYRTTTGGASATSGQTSQTYKAAFYISIFGLEGEYEKTNHDLEAYGGSLGVRLLGTSNQGTNLTVKYGLRRQIDKSTDPDTEWSNQYAEASLNIYLVKSLGLHGEYRHYFPDESSTGVDLRGNRSTAGVFIDVGFVRLYGDYFQEKMDYDNGTSVTSKEREGYEYGARLYF